MIFPSLSRALFLALQVYFSLFTYWTFVNMICWTVLFPSSVDCKKQNNNNDITSVSFKLAPNISELYCYRLLKSTKKPAVHQWASNQKALLQITQPYWIRRDKIEICNCGNNNGKASKGKLIRSHVYLRTRFSRSKEFLKFTAFFFWQVNHLTTIKPKGYVSAKHFAPKICKNVSYQSTKG